MITMASRRMAALAVLNSASRVSAVAVMFGVTGQTAHRWLRRYAAEGRAGLADASARSVPADAERVSSLPAHCSG